MTKSVPQKALKLIAWGKLAFDENVVLPRVGGLHKACQGRGSAAGPGSEAGSCRTPKLKGELFGRDTAQTLTIMTVKGV